MPVRWGSGNDPAVFRAFDRGAGQKPGLTEDHRDDGRHDRRRLGGDVLGLVGYGVFDIGARRPAGGGAEVLKRVLGHEVEDMGILLSANLKAEAGLGRGRPQGRQHGPDSNPADAPTR